MPIIAGGGERRTCNPMGGPRETNNSRKTNKKSDTGVEDTQISISWVAYIHK